MSKSVASSLGRRELQHLGAELLAQRPFVENEADIECLFQRILDRRDFGIAKTFLAQRLMRNGNAMFERAMPTA